MDALFEGVTLTDIHADLARNIVSLRVSENLFDDLSDDPKEQQAAVQLEMAAKPPQYRTDSPVIHRPFDEAAWIEAVQFPFDHWSKSRYSNGRFGVWYGSDIIETTIYETVYHWRTGLLADAGLDQDGATIERKVYWVRCDAALIDLRRHINTYPDLVHPYSYTLTQQVGERLHQEGHPGLVTHSARCEGDVYAILNPGRLSNPKNACFLTYRLNNGKVEVEREIGKTWLVVD